MATAWGGSEQSLILAGGVVGFLEAATLAWLDTQGTDVEAATDLLLQMIWGGISNLDGATGVRLPPHSGFDRSTFVPRGVVLADGAGR
jgi:hypothetical protein